MPENVLVKTHRLKFKGQSSELKLFFEGDTFKGIDFVVSGIYTRYFNVIVSSVNKLVKAGVDSKRIINVSLGKLNDMDGDVISYMKRVVNEFLPLKD